MSQVTEEGLSQVLRNFEWVLERVLEMKARASASARGRVVCVLGSASDVPVAKEVAAVLTQLMVPCVIRVCSAHKTTEELLQLVAQYEGTCYTNNSFYVHFDTHISIGS